MTGLVPYPAPGTDTANAQVVADGWFPPVTLAAAREIPRLGEGTVPTARLTAAIEGAMLTAFRLLAVWRSTHAAAGVASLAGVTDLTLNARNRAVVLWERIVIYSAAAELQGQYRDISATDDGLDRAAEKVLTADDSRRIAHAAVADLLSIGPEKPVLRNAVELI
jgi:hypothetical protein